MAFSDLEQRRFEKTVKAYIEARRPPAHVRPELDLGYRIAGQSIEVFEVRPAHQHPGEIIEHGIAKATYLKSKKIWKIYWMRADLKWHRYEPCATVTTIEDFIAAIDEDPYGCFFG